MRKTNIKVKKGQVLRKKDSGRLAIVGNKNKGDRVMMNLLPDCNRTHSTRIQDVQMFWELVSK